MSEFLYKLTAVFHDEHGPAAKIATQGLAYKALRTAGIGIPSALALKYPAAKEYVQAFLQEDFESVCDALRQEINSSSAVRAEAGFGERWSLVIEAVEEQGETWVVTIARQTAMSIAEDPLSFDDLNDYLATDHLGCSHSG